MHPRSAIPRVVGIIGLPFACVGIAGSILFTFGPARHRELGRHEHLASTVNWLYIWLVVSGLLFATRSARS